jgi:membrane protease YdiL (CAAX protease family)
VSNAGLWKGTLLIARAVLAGFLITALAGGLWTTLVMANLGTVPTLPWAVPVMAVVLWLLWQYLSGKGWPRRLAATRQRYLRANHVPVTVWKWALFAGVSAVVSLAGLWIVVGQLVTMPPNQLPDMSPYPAYVGWLMVIMASLVAPISEEAGFRGYTQVPLEKRYGPVIAILISSLAFTLVHFTHGLFLPKLFLYFMFGVNWGVSARLTNSILPGIVTHIIADLILFLLVWPQDAGRILVWEGGADLWFWIHVVQVLVFGSLAVFGFCKLARLVPRTSQLG